MLPSFDGAKVERRNAAFLRTANKFQFFLKIFLLHRVKRDFRALFHLLELLAALAEPVALLGLFAIHLIQRLTALRTKLDDGL